MKYSWISSVNQLLDNLDTNVGDVVENQVDLLNDELGITLDGGQGNDDNGGGGGSGDGENGAGGGGGTIAGVGGESSVDDILAKRGLLDEEEEEHDEDDDEDDEEDEEEEGEDIEEEEQDEDEQEKVEINNEQSQQQLETERNDVVLGDDEIEFDQQYGNEYNDDEFVNANENDPQGEVVVREEEEVDESNDMDLGNDEEIVFEEGEDATPTKEIVDGMEVNDTNNDENVDTQTKNETLSPSLQQQQQQQNKIIETLNNQLQQIKQQNQKLRQQTQQQSTQLIKLKQETKDQKSQLSQQKKDINASNKETRKLRRNVVKLNAALDSAEHELDAQRTELERAAVRMEKERQRFKDDKERLVAGHKEDMKAVMEEHKSSIDTIVTSHAEQMVDMEERIKRAEEARAKEGGDMSMELAEAAERERETLKKVMSLEEEKSTLTSQIASLNTQLAASQSRVESLQEAAEVASEQEREADDRLDAALSLHARQIGQRQAREAELERTIADIAAALVVARQREAQGGNNNVKKHFDDSDNDVGLLKERLSTAEDEIETYKAQIMLERQKSETLQKELEDVSQERTQELSTSLARQKQHDRRVTDLTAQVTQLQSKLRSLNLGGDLNEEEKEGDVSNAHFHYKEMEYKKEIAALTEDLLRQRGRLENSSTEVLTLRNRLRAALNRAEIAEKEAKASSMVVESNYDIERGPLTNNYGNKTRRRFGGRAKKSATIRSALRLDSSSINETQEAVGGTIDALDMATVKTLNYLRMDPYSRLFFLVYLVVLHLWIFCLLAFHAHGTLEPSANVGPEQLLKHSYRHMEQVHGKP